MYELHPQSRKRAVQTTIHIYAEVRRTNHQASQSGDCGRHAGPSKTSASAALMQEKKEFYERIKEKHGASGYSDEQLHMWAYLVATKRHDSEEYPPAKRFFGREGKGKKSSQEKASSSEEFDASAASGSSFATCTSQRDTIVRQIRELVNLRNIGGLTEQRKSFRRSGRNCQRPSQPAAPELLKLSYSPFAFVFFFLRLRKSPLFIFPLFLVHFDYALYVHCRSWGDVVRLSPILSCFTFLFMCTSFCSRLLLPGLRMRPKYSKYAQQCFTSHDIISCAVHYY